jgi:hypothetical protein
MKNKITLIIILLFAGKNMNATPEIDVYSLQGKHIEFTIWYRYDSSIERLYYKSLLENLDSFIDKLKQTGKLNRGKIHFKIMTAIWMDNAGSVEMYRYKNGYYCCLNSRVQPVTQDYMTKIITYFASDNWESFCPDNSKVEPQKGFQIFNRRIDTITISHEYGIRKVLEINDLSVYYQNDSLICKGANKVYGKIEHLLPFYAGSRYFITFGEAIYVVENDSIINQIQLTEGFPFECRNEVFPKWVNFRGSLGYFLSYSIEKNKFSKIKSQ